LVQSATSETVPDKRKFYRTFGLNAPHHAFGGLFDIVRGMNCRMAHEPLYCPPQGSTRSSHGFLACRSHVLSTGTTNASRIARATGLGFNEVASYLERMERDGTLSSPD